MFGDAADDDEDDDAGREGREADRGSDARPEGSREGKMRLRAMRRLNEVDLDGDSRTDDK